LLIISGETHYKSFSQYIFDHLKNNIKIDLIKTTEKPKKNYSWVLGLGGGQVLDKAKYLAASMDASFISVPTLIAHDGICSPVSVIDGKSLGAIMPHSLFVPLFIIKESPIIHIQAGIGDLIANLSAIDDWKLSKQKTNEAINDFAIMVSQKSASDIILKLKTNYSNPNFLSPIDFLQNDNFLSNLAEDLALSGIAMSLAGNSRPCSGAEHLISHAIDKVYGAGNKAPHGIQVLIASIYLEKYRDQSSLESIFCSLDELKKILEYYRFPTEFSDINISSKELEALIRIAPEMRPGRYSILNEIFIKNH